jgi:hypothetical protein
MVQVHKTYMKVPSFMYYYAETVQHACTDYVRSQWDHKVDMKAIYN